MSTEKLEPLENTGERMLPHASGLRLFWEHACRYRFACQFAPGMRVLDIACGEGYGSASLARAGAAQVIGIDVSPDAVAHARSRYGIDARVGDAEAIPLPDRSVDVVVSFETVEHVGNPAKFIDECARVLKPGGLLVMSTPEVEAYRSADGLNPFHCSEMGREEFLSLVGGRFSQVEIFGQCFQASRLWHAALFSVGAPRATSFLGRWYQRLAVKALNWRSRGAQRDPAKAIAAGRELLPILRPFSVRKWPDQSTGAPIYMIVTARLTPATQGEGSPVAESRSAESQSAGSHSAG